MSLKKIPFHCTQYKLGESPQQYNVVGLKFSQFEYLSTQQLGWVSELSGDKRTKAQFPNELLAIPCLGGCKAVGVIMI